MELADAIKSAIIEVMKATKPCDCVVGKVESLSPISVRISEKITLKNGNLKFCKGVVDLKVDDEILCIRKSGGQIFYVVDKVVDKYDTD
jgi:hypothetical protein